MNSFDLHPAIAEMVLAKNRLRDHYSNILLQADQQSTLRFTLDGNLVGDIGEAIAVELFGISLVKTKSAKGIDGHTPDGKKTVQIKATGTGLGPAFRNANIRADHLLFFEFNFEEAKGTIVFNGPESYAFGMLPAGFKNQRSLTRNQIREADLRVKPEERLVRL